MCPKVSTAFPSSVRAQEKGRSFRSARGRWPRRSGLGEYLGRVVHLVLDRMRGVLEADHLGHLQLDVAVDEVVIEHATGLEEFAILVEVRERLAQLAAHRRDLLQLLRRQIVEV